MHSSHGRRRRIADSGRNWRLPNMPVFRRKKDAENGILLPFEFAPLYKPAAYGSRLFVEHFVQAGFERS
ncbi:MAG: hypothetical protein K0R28_4430 [Paenibacillus sp.]|nr:hypothetical protein [Paenibacillus sp.]